jgi:hypothetical protein
MGEKYGDGNEKKRKTLDQETTDDDEHYYDEVSFEKRFLLPVRRLLQLALNRDMQLTCHPVHTCMHVFAAPFAQSSSSLSYSSSSSSFFLLAAK